VDTRSLIIDLLGSRSPGQARDFLLAWDERRHSSWADAAREARDRAASGGHLPHMRGQLRYHLGEAALADTARAVKTGIIPLPTRMPGGFCFLARVGRFALVSTTIRQSGRMPRRSTTRRFLSQPNQEIDPQHTLFGDASSGRGATELAYLGCLVAVPSRRDPTTPAEVAIAIPNAGLSDWIDWIPLHKAHALLHDRTASAGLLAPPVPAEIPDRVFSTFRLPKDDEDAQDDTGV
jgi:hypothetical protein